MLLHNSAIRLASPKLKMLAFRILYDLFCRV
jgi:hypothetical protein